MPVTTEWVDGLLIVSAVGAYASQELRDVGGAALTEDSEGPPVPVLLDMSLAEGLADRPSEQIRTTVEHFVALRHRVRRVAIIASEDLVYGLMAQAKTFAWLGELETQVFREREEGLAWLREDPAPPA